MQGGSGKDMVMSRRKMSKGYRHDFATKDLWSDNMEFDKVWESEKQLSELIEEIMSLGRERKDLLHSLTPTFSHWQQIDGGEGKFQAGRTWRNENMDSGSKSNSADQVLSSKDQMERESEESELTGESELIEDNMSPLQFPIPTLSHWEQIDGGEGKFKATTWRDRKEEYMSGNMASALVQHHNMLYNQNTASLFVESYLLPYARSDDNKELTNLFNVILEDMDDWGRRMLSMAYVVDKHRPSLPSYKANELARRASGLSSISEEFYNYTKDNNIEEGQQVKGQEGEVARLEDFLFLYNNLFSHDMELVLNLEMEMEKEKEKEIEKKKEEEEEKEKEKAQEEEDDESTMEFLKNIMDFYKEDFARHRASWERLWGGDIGRCGDFNDTTTLSSMQFTHYTPGTIPSHAALTGSTLQIYSIKIIKLKGNLKWPLKVRGFVAARDTVDRNRNILFSRSKSNGQLLTKKDPFLSLSGPSRAISAVDPVDFEVELKINDGAESISLRKSYYANGSTSLFLDSCKCTLELSVGRFDTPLQATIVGVRVAKGDWPFKHGCRVTCAEVNGNLTPREVVLLDYHGKFMRVGSDGYFHLSRNVVSVDLLGPLRVVIQAYSESGPAQQGHADFPVQDCQTSKLELSLGNSELEIFVAWSHLAKEKLDLLVD